MALREFLLGRGEFKTADQIIEVVREHSAFDPQREDAAEAEALLIFQTSKLFLNINKCPILKQIVISITSILQTNILILS